MRRFAHLAHAACAPDAASEAVIRRAHQLLLTQRNAEAEELLRDVDGDALPVPARSQVLSMRATNLFWPLANPAAAAELVDNARARHRSGDGPPGPGEQGVTAGAVRPAAQGAACTSKRATPPARRHFRRLPLPGGAAALGDRGQVDAAITASRDAARIAARNPRAAAHAMGVAEHAVTAAVAVGRLADAHTIAAELLEQTRDSPGIAHSVALAVSAMADLGSGGPPPPGTGSRPRWTGFEEFRDNFGVSYRFRIVATQALARSGRPGGRPYHRGPDAPDQTSRLRVHRPGCGARERGHRRRRRPVGAGASWSRTAAHVAHGARSARARGRLPPGGRPVR